MSESVNNTFPWNVREAEMILTSRLDSIEARTPVVTRSEMPSASSCSVSFSISLFTLMSSPRPLSSSASMSGSSSPLTEEALEAVLELSADAFAFEVRVFLGALPSASRFA